MFINIPENYSSTYKDLIYEYQTSTESEVQFTITSTLDDEVLSVKKLYGCSVASVNVAPLVRNISTPKPELLEMGFSIPDHTSVGVEVECDGTVAPVRYFVSAVKSPSMNTQMTTMSAARTLAQGEQDDIVIHTSESVTLYANINKIIGGKVVDQQEKIGVTDGRGISIFAVKGEEFDPEIERVEISISSDEHPQPIVEIAYTIVPKRENSYRLAWVSSAGSVEHYTFPKVVKSVARRDGLREITLVSEYELSSTLEAIAEIVSSKGVWAAREDGYTEVEVTTSEVATYRDGKLSLIELKVVENG